MPSATFQRPTESIYFSSSNPPVLAALNLEDTQLYLKRLGIDPALAHSPPSLELLSLILVQHHLTIPYDSSAIHVSDWDAEGPITWRNGRGMELGRGNFERIVGKDKDGKQKTGKNGLPMGGGGYCFALNQSCTALLRGTFKLAQISLKYCSNRSLAFSRIAHRLPSNRSFPLPALGFGFRVSEIPARVFLHRGRDPVDGTLWSCTTHSALLVDYPGSEQRYFLDVGFGGGGSAVLLPFQDGATAPSLSKSESFLIKFEKMPMGEVTLYADPPDGFTLYRRVVEAGVEIKDHRVASDGPGYWTPCVSRSFLIDFVVGTDAVSYRFIAQSLLSVRKTSSWATSSTRIIRLHLGRTSSSFLSSYRTVQEELSVMAFLRSTNTLQHIQRERSWRSCTRKKGSRDQSTT